MFKGWRLEAEIRKGDGNVSNSIWEFTAGELKGGWTSDKAKNLYMLTRKGDDFDMSLRSRSFKMTLAVPRSASNLNFQKGQEIQTFVINLFKISNSGSSPDKSIIFRDIEILTVIPRDFSRVPNSSAGISYSEVLMQLPKDKDSIGFPD